MLPTLGEMSLAASGAEHVDRQDSGAAGPSQLRARVAARLHPQRGRREPLHAQQGGEGGPHGLRVCSRASWDA